MKTVFPAGPTRRIWASGAWHRGDKGAKPLFVRHPDGTVGAWTAVTVRGESRTVVDPKSRRVLLETEAEIACE